MPKTTFGQDKVRQSPTGFPKLKLEKDQITRVVCIEPGPVYEWVHNLQKPKISPVDGKPKMVWVKKRNSEDQVQDFDMEFVGTPICLGDPDVLEEQGIDPTKCPACKLSKETDFVRPPQRRFAIHVLQYETKPGTPNLSQPFSVRCLVWVMSEGRFTSVTEVLSEFSEDGNDVDPRKVDLILGKCESAAFQNYPIKAAQQCALTASRDNLQRGMQTYQENHASDLSAYCGRKVDIKYLSQDLEDIVTTWERVRNGGSKEREAPDVTDTLDLDASLLDSSQVAASKEDKPGFKATPASDAPGEGDPLNEFKPGGSLQDVPPDENVVEESVTATVTPAKETTPPKKEEDVPDFEDLLANLGVSAG